MANNPHYTEHKLRESLNESLRLIDQCEDDRFDSIRRHVFLSLTILCGVSRELAKELNEEVYKEKPHE